MRRARWWGTPVVGVVPVVPVVPVVSVVPSGTAVADVVVR